MNKSSKGSLSRIDLLQTHASYILGGLQDTPRTVHETIFRFVKDYFWG